MLLCVLAVSDVTGFSKGKKECALYVSDLKPYKLLSDAMVDVGKLAVQFVYKLEIFGKG